MADQQNPADPLVSLIQSLSEIRPLAGGSVVTGQASTNNNGIVNIRPEQSLILPAHESHQQHQASLASIVTVGGSAINTFATPNQSPKAWQSSNTHQVR